jgi:hypothetical protein
VSSDKQSVDPSTLVLNINPYNNPTDGQIETENNVEVDEDCVEDFLQSDIFDPRS